MRPRPTDTVRYSTLLAIRTLGAPGRLPRRRADRAQRGDAPARRAHRAGAAGDATASATTSPPSCSIAAGDNPERLTSEAAFAHLCGVAPLEASSGKTRRHRLNRGGNRQANNALYCVVITRMRRTSRPRTTSPAAAPKASRPARSSASSSATSPAKPSSTSAHSPPADRDTRRRRPDPTNRPTPSPGCSTNELSTAATTRPARAVTYQEPALAQRVAHLCLVHPAPAP